MTGAHWVIVATIILCLLPGMIDQAMGRREAKAGRHRQTRAKKRATEQQWLDDLTAQHRAHSDRWVLS